MLDDLDTLVDLDTLDDTRLKSQVKFLTRDAEFFVGFSFVVSSFSSFVAVTFSVGMLTAAVEVVLASSASRLPLRREYCLAKVLEVLYLLNSAEMVS